MKRFISIILLGVLLLTFASCSDGGRTTTKYSSDVNTDDKADLIPEDNDKENSADLNDWLEIDCPSCEGGTKTELCYLCEGTGYMFNGKRTCVSCKGGSGGTDFCYVCNNKSVLKIINYEKDESAMTYDEFCEKIEALGERPRSVYKCTACNGKGSCSKCSNVGYVVNNSYNEESDEWDEKLDAILEKCIYTASASDNDNKYSNSGDTNENYNSTGNGGYYYNKPERECTYCKGTGKKECSSCSGKGGRYKTEYAPNYAGNGSSTSYQVWQSCVYCGGSGTQDCGCR